MNKLFKFDFKIVKTKILMKRLLLSASAISMFASLANAQCTPVDCSADLPAYGGVCDTMMLDGVVGQAYADFESFVLTPNCFDAGLIDPGSAGTQIKITNIDNFSYSGFPAGVTGQTNQSSYSPGGSTNTLGCIGVTGTPTEIGVFNLTMAFLADVVTCGFIQIPQNDNPADYVLWMTVKPVPTFTGLATNYCITDGAVNMTVTGTTGGTFTGPGVTGNQFNPATAGVGTHEIKYLVSAQQGSAIAPAADSMIVMVEVFSAGTTFYEDADNDGYGDPNSTATGCTIPTGFVSNNDDCDDTDPTINPGATDIPDNGIDEDCSGADAVTGIDELAAQKLQVYPNPTNGVMTVHFGDITINSVVLMDLNGRVVKTISADSNVVNTDLSSLNDGVYIMNISTEKGSIQKRIVVQK